MVCKLKYSTLFTQNTLWFEASEIWGEMTEKQYSTKAILLEGKTQLFLLFFWGLIWVQNLPDPINQESGEK